MYFQQINVENFELDWNYLIYFISLHFKSHVLSFSGEIEQVVGTQYLSPPSQLRLLMKGLVSPHPPLLSWQTAARTLHWSPMTPPQCLHPSNFSKPKRWELVKSSIQGYLHPMLFFFHPSTHANFFALVFKWLRVKIKWEKIFPIIQYMIKGH